MSSCMQHNDHTSHNPLDLCSDIDRKLAAHEIELTIPEGAELLDQQVAGHRFGISRHKLGLLRHSASRDILKPICDKRSEREWKFYSLVWSEEPEDSCIKELRQLVPKFTGLFLDQRMSVNYIRLEDITTGLRNASVLDMKMGRITHDPEASEAKIRSEMSKYKYAQELGFRILGIRIFDRTTQQYVIHDKEFGVQVTPDNAAQALLTYAQSDLRILTQFHSQLTEIRRWFRATNLHRWKFISSSLFLVYGDQKSDGEPRALIKMIDFAHVFPNDGKSDDPKECDGIDWNYLYGLDRLDEHLRLAIDQLNQQLR